MASAPRSQRSLLLLPDLKFPYTSCLGFGRMSRPATLALKDSTDRNLYDQKGLHYRKTNVTSLHMDHWWLTLVYLYELTGRSREYHLLVRCIWLFWSSQRLQTCSWRSNPHKWRVAVLSEHTTDFSPEMLLISVQAHPRPLVWGLSLPECWTTLKSAPSTVLSRANKRDKAAALPQQDLLSVAIGRV